MSARPNLVWVCADDYAAEVSGAYGNARVRTPQLDRLAGQGLRFDRAFCNCPLSTPSRQAFWTGRYPRSIGVTLSRTPLPHDEVTLPARLRAAGYHVAAFGKTHYYAARKHEFDVCADHVEHSRWLTAKGARPVPAGVRALGPWRPFLDPAAVWLNADCLPVPACDEDMQDAFYARQAERYLDEGPPRPFFLYVSLGATHSPFRFPPEFRGRHDPASFPVPEVGPEERDDIPLVFRGLTRRQKQGILAAYYTATEYLDRNVGIVLDALDRSGVADETVVVFTSDHGYLLGQHGRFEKHCCYEPAIRTALLLRWPGTVSPGRSTRALVELIDLVPTLLELAGLVVPANVQGRSLLPLLRGETDTHRGHVVVEYADNEEAAIRTDTWKLVYCRGRRRRRDGYALDRLPGRSIRLYDLEADPGETTSLAPRPEHAGRVNDLIARLAEHMRRTARHPGLVPDTGDAHVVLEHCLGPQEELPV
jgi:arylsulfatase A-like enzyme